jgi:hypothetical protein
MPRPRKTEVGDYTPPTPSPNGDHDQVDHPWTRIVEVSVADIPARATGRWVALYRELLLRLEQTPPKLALAITFRDSKTLDRAASSLWTLFREHQGKGAIRIDTVVTDDGTPTLYIRRGENWDRRHASSGK